MKPPQNRTYQKRIRLIILYGKFSKFYSKTPENILDLYKDHKLPLSFSTLLIQVYEVIQYRYRFTYV